MLLAVSVRAQALLSFCSYKAVYTRLAPVFWSFAAISCFTNASAQTAALDPSWAATNASGAGKAVTAVNSGYNRAFAIARQPDGKVLVAGYCKNDTTPGSVSVNEDFCAARYLPNGALDTSWNNTGTVVTPVYPKGPPFGIAHNRAYAIAIQPDGKVLLAGECGNGLSTGVFVFCSARYNADGSLDTTWNGTGILTTAAGSNNSASAFAIGLLPDGKVLLAGTCVNVTGPSLDFCSVRYTANGALDTSWNGTGIAITKLSDGTDIAYALAMQPDGKLILAGQCQGNDFTDDFCAARYNANGTLDGTWNSGGTVITPFVTGVEKTYDRAYAIALQPDGKVLVAGACLNSNAAMGDFCALRYTANGALDAGWNGNGKVITDTGIAAANDSAYGIALQPDGKVLLGGACYNGINGQDFCTMRYLANGALDTTWNGNGILMTQVDSTNDFGAAVSLQPDGKFLIAGTCTANGLKENFCTIRLGGGPVTKVCSLDIDGDGAVRAATDGLMISRYLRPYATTGSLIGGVSVASGATRVDGNSISNFLDTRNLDIDGDGALDAATDGLILLRVMLGLTGDQVVQDIAFAANATRKEWTAIRPFLNTQCGMQIP